MPFLGWGYKFFKSPGQAGFALKITAPVCQYYTRCYPYRLVRYHGQGKSACLKGNNSSTCTCFIAWMYEGPATHTHTHEGLLGLCVLACGTFDETKHD